MAKQSKRHQVGIGPDSWRQLSIMAAEANRSRPALMMSLIRQAWEARLERQRRPSQPRT